MDNNEHIISTEEFNAAVRLWGDKVKAMSQTVLIAETSSYSGSLRSKLKVNVYQGRDDGVAKSIGFKFMRYGVFVAYGVGIGHIRQGEAVVRGQKAERYTGKIRNGPFTASSNGSINRKSVDWLDKNIEKEIQQLADITGDYYGDLSMQHVIEELDRIKMKK